MTVPNMAATTGTGSASRALNNTRYSTSRGGPLNSPMSAPEKKVEPSQSSTMPRMDASSRIWSIASVRPARTAAVIVLTGGLWTTISASSPSRSTRTGFDVIGSVEILESLQRIQQCGELGRLEQRAELLCVFVDALLAFAQGALARGRQVQL